MVNLDQVHKSYGPVPVLRGVTLQVADCERIAILGRSGSGKSTLLHLIGGLDVPTSGSILVNGINLSRMTRNQRAEYRLRTIGVIFQSFHLMPTLTAVENVELPAIAAGTKPRERRRHAMDALVAVGLGHRLGHRPTELSGGERQRVAVARAIANRPKMILADEPTGNLDSTTGAEVMDLLKDHVARLKTILILVTHDEELARRYTDRLVRMQDGLIVT